MSELKPCPFCGKEMQKYDNCGDENIIWCSNCGATGPNDLTPALAEKMWNMRRPEDALCFRIAELKSAIERKKEYIIKLEAEIPQTNLDLANASLKVAELQEANRWIPVSERLPEDKGEYLC